MASRARAKARPARSPSPPPHRGALSIRARALLSHLSAHEHRTAAGIFVLLVLVYLWPVLVGGGMLSPLTGLYVRAPWIGLAPHGMAHFTNTGLEDVSHTYYPWDVLARALIHSGTFPAWSPHALGGTPFWANPEVAWLSPFSLPLWILPLNYGLGVAAALKLWMAGFGTYLLVRELRLGFWPGVLAGVSFAFCAFNIVWLSHGVQVSVAVMLPWVLWLAERLVRRGRSVDGLALAVVVAVVSTGGHPGTQLHVLAAAVLFALVCAACSGDVARGELARRLGLVAGALAVGVMVAAVVLLPAQQAAVGTAGAFARRNGSVEFLGSRVSLAAWRTALFPDWWGRLSEDLIGGPASYNERTFYAGTVALLLALVGIVSDSAWRRKAPFLLLAVVGLLVPVRALGTGALMRSLPLFNAVQNQRILLWFLLAVAVLAAFGLQVLLDAPSQGRAWGVVAAGAVASVVAFAGIHGAAHELGGAVSLALDRSGRISEAIVPLASVLWWSAFVVALSAFLLLMRRRMELARLAGALIVLLAALDMLHFAHGYQPMGPASEVVPPRTPAIAYLQRHVGDGRIAGLEFSLPPDTASLYGLRDARGYDQPQPSMRFYRLWRAVEPATTPGSTFIVESLSPDVVRVLSLLGARDIIAKRETQVRSPVLSLVYRARDAVIFRNELAMPRAMVAANVQVAAEEREELGGVLASGFDPRRDVVVRKDELGRHGPLHGGGRSGTRGSVRVLDDAGSRVELAVTLSRAGVVVLDDVWAPGWSVEVDGRPAHPLQTDVVLRGVEVAAGQHQVVWNYRAPGLRMGIVVSGVGLLVLLGWGVVLVRR